MMSNTAVQRRVADLKAAGINPMLAAGQAADVPNVAPAHVENAFANGLGLGKAATAKMAYDQNQANIELQKAQARKADAEGRNADAQGKWINLEAKARLDNMAGSTAASHATARLDNERALTQAHERGLIDAQTLAAIKDADLKGAMTQAQLAGIGKIAHEIKLLDAQAGEADARRILALADTNLAGWNAYEKAQLVPVIKREKELAIRNTELGMPARQAQANVWDQVLRALVNTQNLGRQDPTAELLNQLHQRDN